MSSKLVKQYQAVLSRQDLWQKTPLLKVLEARLQKMLKRLNSRQVPELPREKNDCDLEVVYVLLYYQGGGSLSIWESQLKRICHSVKSRPVFLTEIEAKSCIFDKFVEGFAKLQLPKSAILINESGYYIKDKVLTEKAVSGFFWQNIWYSFANGRLVPMLKNID